MRQGGALTVACWGSGGRLLGARRGVAAGSEACWRSLATDADARRATWYRGLGQGVHGREVQTGRARFVEAAAEKATAATRPGKERRYP